MKNRDSWTIVCPYCGFEGGDQSDFNMNMTDECFCPECRERFEFEYPEDEDCPDDYPAFDAGQLFGM